MRKYRQRLSTIIANIIIMHKTIFLHNMAKSHEMIALLNLHKTEFNRTLFSVT